MLHLINMLYMTFRRLTMKLSPLFLSRLWIMVNLMDFLSLSLSGNEWMTSCLIPKRDLNCVKTNLIYVFTYVELPVLTNKITYKAKYYYSYAMHFEVVLFKMFYCPLRCFWKVFDVVFMFCFLYGLRKTMCKFITFSHF